MKRILFLLLLFLLNAINAQDVVINEVISSNIKTIYDEDGDTPNRIELYNSNDHPVYISGWYFSDSDDNHKFILPDGNVINPDS